MNILVINGSPRGRWSTTLQTAKYLEILHPEHRFEFLEAASRIRWWERDFSQAREKLEGADLLLFCHPVYTFLVPSQLHRFLQLMAENHVDIRGTYATQITTSKHFYDVTAHRFLTDNLKDFGLRVLEGLSADMEDLLSEKGRRDAESFFRYVLWQIRQGLGEIPPEAPAPAFVPRPVTIPAGETPKKGGNVIIVTDCAPEDVSLQRMISRFRKVLSLQSTVVNIRDFPMKGGCLGCLHCAADGTCIYTDGFSELLRQKIQKGDAIVTAFTIREHSKGYLFKMYDDRQFCNGHRTVTMGMPMGYLVSGPLSREENVRLLLEAEPQVGGNWLAGTACDETDPDGSIDALARRIAYGVRQKYTQPANFYGVGGMKIFRDLIWLMQGMMKADHRFYREHNQYDFPQKKRGTMLMMYLVGGMAANPRLRDKMGNRMNEGMLAPYEKVLRQAEEDARKSSAARGKAAGKVTGQQTPRQPSKQAGTSAAGKKSPPPAKKAPQVGAPAGKGSGGT